MMKMALLLSDTNEEGLYNTARLVFPLSARMIESDAVKELMPTLTSSKVLKKIDDDNFHERGLTFNRTEYDFFDGLTFVFENRVGDEKFAIYDLSIVTIFP